ncbi:MAG: heavy metal translocating P-type ATPase, partial [Candidatus Bathyarchaeia archaeon]
EKAQNLTTVVFDKTGTLTKGKPEVTDILPLQNGDSVSSEIELLELAASAEGGSEHPLGKTIVKAAKDRRIGIHTPSDFQAVPGHGIKASLNGVEVLVGNRRLMEKSGVDLKDYQASIRGFEIAGKTTLLVAKERKMLGIIAVADTLKESAIPAVKSLQNRGIEVVMLTGDNERTARFIASQLNIRNVIAEVLPDGKIEAIKRLQEEGKVVAMVGDGINDAPALAQSDIGIAIGSGTDIAKETGGIVLVKDDVRDVAVAIDLSKTTMRKIKQNLFLSLVYNTALIPVAAFGLLSPILAAAAMSMSSVSVVGNSATLRRYRPRIYSEN